MNIKEFFIILAVVIFIILGKSYDNKVRREAYYNALINAERYESERQLEVYNRIY